MICPGHSGADHGHRTRPTCGPVRMHLLWLMSITLDPGFHPHVHPYPAMHVDLYADKRPPPQPRNGRYQPSRTPALPADRPPSWPPGMDAATSRPRPCSRRDWSCRRNFPGYPLPTPRTCRLASAAPFTTRRSPGHPRAFADSPGTAGSCRGEVEAAVHVEPEPPVGVDVRPEQRGQAPPVFLGELSGPGRVA